MGSPDPIVRRVSASMLARLEIPAAITALVDALQDDDDEVRLISLTALAHPRAAPALLDIAARLADPVPVIRARAVDTLRALGLYPRGLRSLITPLLDDPDSLVRVRAALTLLNLGEQDDARRLLRQMSMSGSLDERILALEALADAGDPLALTLFETELADSSAPSVIRRASANALGSCGPAAIPVLITALAVEDDLVRDGIASAFGRIGEDALPGLCAALDEPALERGALLALEQLPARKAAAYLQTYARKRIGTSIHYETIRQSIPAQRDDRLTLLSESLAARSRRDGIFALRALRLATSNSSSYETLTVAIENLQSRIPEQVSNALESLEAIPEIAINRPLFVIWEPGQEIKPASGLQQALAQLLDEPDEWLRKCANYAALSKEQDMDTPPTFSIMDRVLILRRVPLLAELSPADLQRVAAIATELDFGDGEVICAQGENGDEMYVIVTGSVRVVVTRDGQLEREIARRAAGDVIGEMSIISGETRMASVIASSDVRVLCLDRLSFESLLRERPEVSLAVMRVLCNRLKQTIE